ncbi:MAG: hypothetical protein GY856_14290 [bacterium]|nr:hypothetical protein [bacterium]
MKKVWIAWFITAASLVVAFVAAAAPAAEPAGDEPAATVRIEELTRGQKGYGLSVFAGTEPERFEVEVLGVIHDVMPELSYLMVRLSGRDLERNGVLAGMSGSPVYFDGRLAGAVSYGYSFGLDAIAGVTPIDAMRRLHEQARRGGPQAAVPAASVGWEELLKRDFSSEQLSERLRRLQPRFGSGASSALQWSASGFGDQATSLLRQAVGELTPWAAGAGQAAAAGSERSGAAPAAAVELGPGSAVAIPMILGDFRLAAHGTVTDRRGDEILALGHPLFALGATSLPLMSSEVVTVIASRANSFKLSNVGAVVGAVDLDREAGIHGRLGLAARTIPVNVRLRGLVERDFAVQVVDMPVLTPNLISLSVLSALEASTYAYGSQGLDLEVRFQLADHQDLVVRQSFDGDQAGIDSAVYLLNFTTFLEHNGLEEVELEAVDIELHQVERLRTATLVGAWADRTLVEPGDTVRLTAELQAYRGERYRRVVETKVPPTVPEGRYSLLIGDGTSMDAARLAVEHRDPESFEQALQLLRSLRSSRELVTAGLYAKPGLATAGEVLPQLPGSVRAIFAAGAPGATPLWLALAHEQSELQDRPIAGILRVDLEVRRR